MGPPPQDSMNRLNGTRETNVSLGDDSDERQEVIEVQILPQVSHLAKKVTQGKILLLKLKLTNGKLNRLIRTG